MKRKYLKSANRKNGVAVMRGGILKACIGLVSSALCSTAFAEPPVVKVLSAPLMAPGAADTWYSAVPNPLTHTFKLCGLAPASAICENGKAARPAQIKELARSLGFGRLTVDAYTSRVFEYVYANIDTEFRYGLSKGAFGALLDQSGTPFDQAMLMVELLRAGGVSASYAAGTITLTGAQFLDWTGVSDRAVACRLLADGGIPGIINGTTTANCSYTGAIAANENVVLSHIWVSSGGKLFDPSFKRYNVKPVLSNLGTITQCGSNTACATSIRGTAIPSGSQGNETLGGKSVPYVQRVQTGALDTSLKNFGKNLEDYIKGNTSRIGWEVEDVAGGRSVDTATIPQPPRAGDPDLRAPRSPQQQRTWTDIPDQYRTKARVQLGLATEIDETLYADELAGNWLTIAGGTTQQSQATSSRYMELHLWLPGITKATTSTLLLKKSNVTASYNTALLTLSIDHPYYAPSASGGTNGTYMDESPGQQNLLMTALDFGSAGTQYLFIPTYVALGWGREGSGNHSYVTRAANDIFVDEMLGAFWPCDGTGVPGESGGVFCDRVLDGAFPTQFSMWMSQSTEAMKLVDGINNSRTEHHHTFGIVGRLQNGVFVDARSAISLQSVANSSNDRKSALASQVAVLGLLEGSSGEQQNDSWGTSSSVGLFSLANEKALATSPPVKTHRFYDTTSSNVTQVLAATTGYSAADKSFIRSYLDSTSPGYSAIVSRDGSIGSYTWGNWTTQLLTTPVFAYSSDDTRIAYVSTGRAKGAVTGVAAYDAAMGSANLTDPSKKKELNFSVDLAVGSFSYTPPADIVTGQGDFPYSLPFQRSISSQNRDRYEVYWLPHPLYPVNLPIDDPQHALGNGWRHNYEVWARIANDGFQALGADSALDASAVITALYAMRSLNVGTQDFQGRVASIFVMDWLGKQLVDNAVIVDRPPESSTYLRLPSGLYNPPPGTAEILLRNNVARTRAIAGFTNFDYTGITMTLTDKLGAVLSFSVSDYEADTSYANQVLFRNKFKADSWVFPDGVRVDFNYPPAVLLSPGNSQTLHFRRYLESVSNNLGRRLTISGPPGGNYATTVTDENNRTAVIGTHADYVTDSAGMTVGHAYAGPGMLSKITMPSGNTVLTIDYDSIGRVKDVIDGAGNRTDSFPAKVSAERFARGETVDPLQNVGSMYFDEGNRPLQAVDQVGRYTTNAYDGIGRLTRTISPEGDSIEYGYDVRGNMTSETRRPKTGSGTLTTTTAYFTGSTTWRCPANETKRCNQRASVDGPRTDVTDVTTYTYSQATGQPVTETGAAISEGTPLTTLAYQSLTAQPAAGGGATSISVLQSKTRKVDATRNEVVTFGYETLANKLALKTITQDPAGANLTTDLGYDVYGNTTRVTDPRLKNSLYCYDGGRRLVRVTRQVGTLDANCAATPTATGDDPVTIQEFNQDGLLSRVRRKDAEAGAWRDTSYSYTPTWSLETSTDPENNVARFAYDANGKVTLSTDPDGYKTRTFYLPDGKIRKLIKGYQFDASSSNEACSVPGTDQQCYAQFNYAPPGGDPALLNGQAYSVTDANGNVTSYTYDTFDRPSRISYADGSYDEILEYDGASNVLQRRNRANEIVVSTFNAVNNIRNKSHASFPLVTFGYDLISRMTSATQTGGQTTSWAFDLAGRLQSTTAGTRTLTYEYDNSGNRRSIKWPDNVYVEYSWDDANRLDLVKQNGSQILADYDYDTMGRKISLLRGNADRTSFKYEADNDLLKITEEGLPTTPIFDFVRSPGHDIKQLKISDPALFWRPANGSRAYEPNSLNQYAKVAGTPYGYDPKGNLTGTGSAVMTYDAENRLMSFTAANVQTIYSYDGLGRRISKKVGSNPRVDFLLDGDEEVAEYDEAGTMLRRYVNGPAVDDRLLMYETSSLAETNKRYYYTNHQGSTTAVADGNGNVTDSYTYGPFGETAPTTGNPFRYTGRRLDPESGLYYYRARYYSPDLGRFLQTDPVGYESDLNAYTYAQNDGVNNTDPAGTDGQSDAERGVCRGASRSECIVYDGEAVQRQNEQSAQEADVWTQQKLKKLHEDAVATADTAAFLVEEAYKDYALGKVTLAAFGLIVGNLARLERVTARTCELHHICTNKSLKTGWTAVFEKVFAKANMKLSDPENLVYVTGHKGRHPTAYHVYVLKRILTATEGYSGIEYRIKLKAELRYMARELQTPGTEIRKLLRAKD